MSMWQVVDSLDTPALPWAIRQATVVSVEAAGTCTVAVGGTTVAGVAYQRPPRPGGSCWLFSDGDDVWVLAGLGGQTAGPYARMVSTSGLPGSAAWYTLPNDSETDEWGALSAAGVFTAPAPGRYLFVLQADFGSNAVGVRSVRLLMNGGTVAARVMTTAVNGVQTVDNISYLGGMSQGDTMEPQVYQTSGGSLATTGAMSAIWLDNL